MQDILLLGLSASSSSKNTGVLVRKSEIVILIGPLFSVIPHPSWNKAVIALSERGEGVPVSFGSHLIEGGDGSRWVAAEAVAPFDGGDDALEVGAVQQLGELQEAVAQDEELAGGWGHEQEDKEEQSSTRYVTTRLREENCWELSQ